MSPDQQKLIEELERKFGKRIQFYAGVYYFDGQALNLNKLEQDFHAWKSARSTVRTERVPRAG